MRVNTIRDYERMDVDESEGTTVLTYEHIAVIQAEHT
jgi:hypothetical protein